MYANFAKYKQVCSTKIILAFIFLLAFIGGVPAGYASGGVTLSISPPAGEFRVGSTFTASLLLDSQEETVGRIGGTIVYPPDMLQVVNPSAGLSLITSWLKTPLVSNFEGRLAFEGAVTPGIKTSGGTVLGIAFRVMAPGKANIQVKDARIERAGESGSLLLAQTRSSVLEFVLAPVQGPHIESVTHPDPNTWVANRDPFFQWNMPDAQGFNFVLDQEPFTIPEKISKGNATYLALSVDRGGIWYLHLIAQEVNGEWSSPGHYALRVDLAAPEKPRMALSEEMQNGRRVYRIDFSSSDALSGIARYEAKITSPEAPTLLAQGFFAEVASPLLLTDPEPGIYRISIRAYDKAGNAAEAEKDVPVGKPSWQAPLHIGGIAIPRSWPWLTAYAAALLALGAFGGLLREVYTHHRNLRKEFIRQAHQAEERLTRDLAALRGVGDVVGNDAGVMKAVEALHDAHTALEKKDELPPPPIAS